MKNKTNCISKLFGVFLAAVLFIGGLPAWARAEEPSQPEIPPASVESAPAGDAPEDESASGAPDETAGQGSPSAQSNPDAAPPSTPADADSNAGAPPSGEQPGPGADSAEAPPATDETTPAEEDAAESPQEDLLGAQEADAADDALLAPQELSSTMTDPDDPDTLHILTNPPISGDPNVIKQYYNPADALSQYDIRLGGASDGTKAMISFIVDLSNSYLRDMRSRYIQDGSNTAPLVGPDYFSDHPGEFPDYATYEAYLDGELPKQAGFEPITFACSFNEDEIVPPSPLTGALGQTDESGNPLGEPIGSFAWSYDATNKKWTLTAAFNPSIINKTQVRLRQTFGLLNNAGGDVDGSAGISPGSGGDGPLVNVHFYGPPDDLHDSDDYYHVDKSVVNSGGKTGDTDVIDGSFVEYRVVVSADDDIDTDDDNIADIIPKLNGKNISDALPAQFWLDDVAGIDILCYKEPADQITGATPLSLTPPIGDSITYTYADPPITLNGQPAEMKTGYSCTFPALSANKSNLIKTAVITYRVRLTQDATVAYLTDPSAGVFKSIENDAVLRRTDKDKNPTDPITDDTATVDMSAGFFQKNGQQLAGNNSVFKWSLDVNCYGVGADNIFVFDTIEIGEHNYITDGSYPITVTDKSGGSAPATLQMAGGAPLNFGANPPDFASMNNGSLPFAQGSPFAAVDKTHYGYYTYDVTDHDTSETRHMAMLVFNTKDYFNQDIEITYYTKVPQEAADLPPSASVRNDAKLIYDTLYYTGGEGPGGNETGVNVNYNLSNNPPIAHRWVDKEGVDYDADTQTLTWAFSVNEFSTELDYLTITDTLQNAEQRFLLEGTGDDITLAKRGGGTRAVPYFDGVGNAPENADYYTLTNDGTATTLFISLTHIDKTAYYTFPVYTKLVDASRLTKEIKAGGTSTHDNTVTNTAQVTGKPAGRDPQPQDTDATGSQRIVNALIAKAVDPANRKFNYDDYSTSWQLTVNPNHLPIANLTVADIFPAGCTFQSLVSVKRYDVDGALVSSAGSAASPIYTVGTGGAAVTGEPVALTLGGGGTDTVGLTMNTDYQFDDGDFTGEDRLLFAFADSDIANTEQIFADKYVIVLTAAFTRPNYRSAHVDVPQPDPIVNGCAYVPPLGGEDGSTVYGAPVSAGATAPNTRMLPPLEKAGKYFKVPAGGGLVNGTNYPAPYAQASGVHWEIGVNRYATDLGGWRVSDTFKAFFELYEDSFGIYEATVDANGVFAVAGNAPNLAETRKADFFPDRRPDKNTEFYNSAGFTFLIPDDYKNKPLVVRFDTLFVDDAKKNDITNSATLSNGSPGGDISTGDIGNTGAPAFYLDDYCMVTEMPFVVLRKHSSTDLPGDGVDYSLDLAGAEFELVSVLKNDDDALLTPPEKIRFTNLSGRAAFLFLTPGKLYRITEITPPPGYHFNEGEDDIHYLYVHDSTIASQDFDASKYSDAGVPADIASNQHLFADLDVSDQNDLYYDLTNDPGIDPDEIGADLTFQKLDNNGAGNAFDGGANHPAPATFRLYREGVYDRSLPTGTNGMVTFPGLELTTATSYYVLTETAGPGTALPFAAPPASWKVTVTLDGSALKVTLADLAATNPKTVTHNGTNYVITNRYVDRPVQLVKTDADSGTNNNGNAANATKVSGAEFKVYLPADKLNPNPATDTLVAYLVERTANGTYYLNPTGLTGSITAPGPLDVNGCPHLRHISGTTYHLLAGDYYFIESRTPPGFKPDETTPGVANTHPFTVNRGSPATLHLTNTGAAGSGYFKNQCLSAPVVLTKSDAASGPASRVTGAVFTVYDVQNPSASVAFLTEADPVNKPGVYTLSDHAGAGTPASAAVPTGQNPALKNEGAPYLYSHNDGTHTELHLLFGDYYFVETTTPNGYLPDLSDPDDGASPLNMRYFTVGAGGSTATCYLAQTDNPNDPADNATTALATARFPNTAIYTPVTLNKFDADSVENGGDLAVSGAVFTVYAMPASGVIPATPGQPVAFLTEADKTGSPGVYTLANQNGGAGPLFATNANGVKYLQGSAIDGFGLIEGDYYFRETTAPTGYFADSDNPLAATPTLRAYPFSVEGSAMMFLYRNPNYQSPLPNGNCAGGDDDLIFDNEPLRAPVTVNKRDLYDGDYDNGAKLYTAEFTIYNLDDEAVAFLVPLTDLPNRGRYMLSRTSGHGGSIASTADAHGRPWLDDVTAPAAPTLLLGSYYAVETTPPLNYLSDSENPDADDPVLRRHYFTVAGGQTLYLSNGGLAPDTNAGNTANPKTVFTNENPAAPAALLKRDSDDRNAIVSNTYFTIFAPEPDITRPGHYLDTYIPVAYLTEQFDADGHGTGNYTLGYTVTLENGTMQGENPDAVNPLAVDARGREYLQQDAVPMNLIYCDDYYFVEGLPAPDGFLPDVDANSDPVKHYFSIHAAGVHYLTNGGLAPGDDASVPHDPTSGTPLPVFTNDCDSAALQLQKRDAFSQNAPVSGAEFTVYLDDGSDPATAVAYLRESADEPGQYALAPLDEAAPDALLRRHGPDSDPAWNLEFGDYFYAETTTPYGYHPDADENGDPVRHAFQVNAHGVLYLSNGEVETAYEDNTLIFTNTAMFAPVLLNKADGETAAPLAGAEFTIYDAADGKPAAYLVEEAGGNGKGAGRYALSAKSAHGGAPLAGAVNAAGRAYLQTDADGGFGITLGQYYFTETTTPEGYAPDKARHLFRVRTEDTLYLANSARNNFLYPADTSGLADDEIALLDEQAAETVFTNRYIMAEIALDKRGSDTNAPLSGAEFKVYTADGGKLVAYLSETKNTAGQDMYMLSPNSLLGGSPIPAVAAGGGRDYLNAVTTGNTTVYELIYGRYYFTETTAPKGYLPETTDDGAPTRHYFDVDEEGLLYLSNDDALSGYQRGILFLNDPINPDVSEPGGGSGAGGTFAGGTAAKPQTGDRAPIALLIVIAVLALAGLGASAGIILARRRRGKGENKSDKAAKDPAGGKDGTTKKDVWKKPRE